MSDKFHKAKNVKMQLKPQKFTTYEEVTLNDRTC